VGVTRPRRLDAAAEDRLWRLVQAGFRERRKMLHNVLPRQLPGMTAARIHTALAQAAIASDRRPQTLSVEEWMALEAALAPGDTPPAPDDTPPRPDDTPPAPDIVSSGPDG
jgi:16S rRNA (adenine1518-N6/adenine1519-N6)-dimethyltransferase